MMSGRSADTSLLLLQTVVGVAAAAATPVVEALFGRPRLRLAAPLALPVVESFALVLPAFALVVAPPVRALLSSPVGCRSLPAALAHSMSMPIHRRLFARMRLASCATVEAVLSPSPVAVAASAVIVAPGRVARPETDPLVADSTTDPTEAGTAV